ncbi:hypothetical protein [Actinoplanes couchii]|uniref:Uncharacterized protein n=1 Tax=Actinoplanes couchii TaxID=403638 RepID=A0ABQ3XH80_9ACTN|nr:hypothetical protein [Actinoplanes couchii]MDR6320664.1 hypothetical protein [Actinoplanes couchii]GID57850.1 hypothetical protein Aco03nite_062540 [Actinoplanes couchii]
MRLPKVTLAVMVVAVLSAMVGATHLRPDPFGIGCLVTLAVLALHPVLFRGALPTMARLSIRAGLFGLAVETLVLTRYMVVWPSTVIPVAGDVPTPSSEIPALMIGTAGSALVAGTMFGLALARLSWRPPRGAVAGVTMLAVAGVVTAMSAYRTWQDTPSGVPEIEIPAGNAADVMVVSSTFVFNPGAGLATAVVLTGAYLLVDRCTRRDRPGVAGEGAGQAP